MPRYYKFTRAIDPNDGSPRFDAARSSYAAGQPKVEKVARCLATRLGTAGYDRTLGVDWDAVAAAPLDARAAVARAAVTTALGRFVARGEITGLAVAAEVQGQGVVGEVGFTDPEDASTQAVPLRSPT